jgi:hypothetical protein
MSTPNDRPVTKRDLEAAIDKVIEHIHGVGAQLHGQIQAVDTRLGERLDRMEARLDKQGGLIQGGSRAITRFIEWTESADTTFTRYDRRLADIEKRFEQLEQGRNGGKK